MLHNSSSPQLPQGWLQPGGVPQVKPVQLQVVLLTSKAEVLPSASPTPSLSPELSPEPKPSRAALPDGAGICELQAASAVSRHAKPRFACQKALLHAALACCPWLSRVMVYLHCLGLAGWRWVLAGVACPVVAFTAAPRLLALTSQPSALPDPTQTTRILRHYKQFPKRTTLRFPPHIGSR